MTWVPGIWKKLNPSRNIVWSVPLTVTGTPLADVANGLHDAEFEAAARAIAEAQPKAIIRLGWEMNLSNSWAGSPRSMKPTTSPRSGASSGFSGAPPREFKYDWCPGWGPQDIAG